MYISRFLQTFFDQFLLLTMNYFDKVGGAGGSWKDVMLREISMDGTIWVGQAREHGRATWVGWKGESNMMSRGGGGAQSDASEISRFLFNLLARVCHLPRDFLYILRCLFPCLIWNVLQGFFSGYSRRNLVKNR